MTVAENIVLANEPTHAGIMLDYKAPTSASATRETVQVRGRP